MWGEVGEIEVVVRATGRAVAGRVEPHVEVCRRARGGDGGGRRRGLSGDTPDKKACDED